MNRPANGAALRQTDRPLAPVALTCGDPSGIGPELAASAWRQLQGRQASGRQASGPQASGPQASGLPRTVPFFWIGDPRHLPPGTPQVRIDSPAQAADAQQAGLPVLAHDFAAPARPGEPDPANAQGVIDVIARGVALVQAGAASALCTAPINKKALKDGAGFAFPGHTEYLAHLAGDVPVVMMLAGQDLRVVPATIHIALEQVKAALTAGLLEQVIRITRAALQRDFGLRRPRICVAGLNPHAGEGGAMGREEIEIIIPVLERLRAEEMHLIGPLSADTMFHPGARARYDAAVCMYHDQALIPIKTIDFSGGVNVTLGLPFVRTSPDHGTAYDIAGRGQADATSLIAALDMAAGMAARRAALRDPGPDQVPDQVPASAPVHPPVHTGAGG